MSLISLEILREFYLCFVVFFDDHSEDFHPVDFSHARLFVCLLLLLHPLFFVDDHFESNFVENSDLYSFDDAPVLRLLLRQLRPLHAFCLVHRSVQSVQLLNE